jgi:soluble lytic murein transglycosylase-like protein
LRSSRLLLLCAVAATVFLTTPAHAQVPHTVAPGETLWSIGAANNFTTRTLAAANGLSEDAQLVAGSTVQIPSEQEAAAALGAGSPAQTTGSAPQPMGAYVVQPGDTLSGIAASSGISAGQLAWMNGVDPSQPLLIGTALKLPTGSELAAQAPAAPAQPVVVPDAEPYAAPGHVTAAQIGEVAASHGVSPSLAAAVAWQESGFNNGVVSVANARGVMQLLPGTWDWVEERLAGQPLAPDSPIENVHAGVMYLRQLVQDAGGDEARAVASYYQGASSVDRVGLLPDTEDYVANVMALRSRFGGP